MNCINIFQQPYPYVQPSASSGSGGYVPNPQSSIHTVQQPYPNIVSYKGLGQGRG